MAAEELLPIDIHYNKLLGERTAITVYLANCSMCCLDWLVDRRHCSLKWRQQLTPVREKMATAFNELPQDARAAASKSGEQHAAITHSLSLSSQLMKCSIMIAVNYLINSRCC